MTAFTILSPSEHAASIPKSGGGYAFVREIFDDFASFIMGWMLWFAYMIAGARFLGELFFLELFVVATRVVVRIGTRHGESRSAPYCACTPHGLVAINAVRRLQSESQSIFTSWGFLWCVLGSTSHFTDVLLFAHEVEEVRPPSCRRWDSLLTASCRFPPRRGRG